MTDFAYNTIDAINREGLDNSAWGLVKNITSTTAYFRTGEDMALQGQWAYVYTEPDSWLPYLDEVTPTHTFDMDDDGARLLLFKLD